MQSNPRKALVSAMAALAIAVPATAAGEQPREAKAQAQAVHACLEYRGMIGADAFRQAFSNVRGCVAMVVLTQS